MKIVISILVIAAFLVAMTWLFINEFRAAFDLLLVLAVINRQSKVQDLTEKLFALVQGKQPEKGNFIGDVIKTLIKK